jgi:hypothetical protein
MADSKSHLVAKLEARLALATTLLRANLVEFFGTV